MSKTNKGFTLIELLVVIAIIGILAAVVLASLNSARDKGADAAVKANLANTRAQAEILYDENSSYDAVCDNDTITQAVDAANDANGGGEVVCEDTEDDWVIAAELASGGTADDEVDDVWCVDSSGAATGYDWAGTESTPGAAISSGLCI